MVYSSGLAALLVSAISHAPAFAASSDRTDTLSQVVDSHELRVCSPGDYKPFSFVNNEGKFEGLDIELVGLLASSLQADVVMVKTSWSDLMKDFTSGKCDIAVGGISVTLERQLQANFSMPYMVNGKTPITRCEDVGMYQSIGDINQPGVHVIYNPGGSNETFATTRLADADLTQHENNITIFDEVAEGRADVFVTESAEALVQARDYDELCAVNPDKPLKYAEMAYLLPEGDIRFKQYVDQWMHLLKASGRYDQLTGDWVPTETAQ